MKTITYKIIVFLLLIYNCSLYAQYNGGDSDGSAYEIVSNTTCDTPPSFFPYFGGNSDGAAIDTNENTNCPFSNHFFAYFGGNGDAAAVETLENTVCGFPPQFFTYFGGENNGSALETTASICAINPPVADFTASTTSICKGQTVTFTDTSTNQPFVWSWTFTGGTPSTSTDQNPIVTYNTAGIFEVVLVATNYNGNGTKTKTAFITVTDYPTITSTTPAARCGSGAVTLQATASAGTLNWYENITGGTSLATGNSFTTPTITASTTYYVEAMNGICSSTRTAVVATVNSAPTITSIAGASRCDAGTVTLAAATSAGNAVWFANATGGTSLATGTYFTTPSISTTTSYFVEAVDGSCASGIRTEVIATINPSPIITSTTPTTICGGTFIISATASAGTLAWYNVPTGGIVQGTGNDFSLSNWAATTTFYVQATDGSCQSPRVPVVVTVIGKPFNTVLYPASRCGTGTVTLGAEYTIGTAQWFTVASGGTAVASGPTFTTPSISSTTTYYVEGLNNGCASEIRTAITATVNNTAAPTGNASQTFCPGSSVGDIVATGTNIVWYDASIGGNVLQTSTILTDGTTYYASQTLGGCESTNRFAVTINLGGCLSVNESSQNTISVYPNPVQNMLFIKSPTTVERVEVYSMAGQKVFTSKFNSKEVRIDFSHYVTATYLVKVFSENSKPKIYKIIRK